MISAIILAAGKSKRMGELKQLLPMGDKTVIEQTIDCFLDCQVDEVIVVLGYKAGEIMERISGKPVKVVINPIYHHGMSTSIVKGLSQVDKGSKAVMLALGDQPFLEKEIINNLIQAFLHNDQGIVIPVYRGIRGHPVIFDIKYKDELLSLTGDIGGKKVIEKYPDDVLEVEVNSGSVIMDIDTKNDYQFH